MANQTETQHAGEFILAEAPGTISRNKVTVTVAASTKLQPGHVLSVLSATGKYVPYDNTGTDGSEEAAAILYDELDNSDNESGADFTGVVIDAVAEVRKADLQWESGVDADGKTAAYADLAAKFVKARD
jgi:hypothetical protein